MEHVTILNYGHYWYEMLRECVEVKKLRLMETATVLKCTTTTVKKRADEIGLNPNQNRKSCIYREKGGSKTDRSQYFRRRVTELLEVQPELTARELEEQIPGAYAWFNKNDFQWLKQRLVIDQEKRYWAEWEEEQLKAIMSAYEMIRETGDPDRRITVGWICTVAGLRESEIKGRLHRFPDIRAFVEEVVEEKEEWLERRFKKIAERKKLVGEDLKMADIRREMSLKPNTYKKHAAFIEELIGRMNGTVT